MQPTKSIPDQLAHLAETWRPEVLAAFNGQEIKIARLHGEFVWHRHDETDEVFLVWSGRLRLEFREHHVWLGPGEVAVIPKGVEHRPVAEQPVEVVLIEQAGTRNTGNVQHDRFTAP